MSLYQRFKAWRRRRFEARFLSQTGFTWQQYAEMTPLQQMRVRYGRM